MGTFQDCCFLAIFNELGSIKYSFVPLMWCRLSYFFTLPLSLKLPADGPSPHSKENFPLAVFIQYLTSFSISSSLYSIHQSFIVSDLQIIVQYHIKMTSHSKMNILALSLSLLLSLVSTRYIFSKGTPNATTSISFNSTIGIYQTSNRHPTCTVHPQHGVDVQFDRSITAVQLTGLWRVPYICLAGMLGARADDRWRFE